MQKFRVILTEYEAGWGSKPFHHEDFDTLEEAQAYQKKNNDQNNLDYVPDYYIVASDPTEVYV